MRNYNDYLIICDEIKLERITGNLDMALVLNNIYMDTYDEVASQNKVAELLEYINELVDLQNEAMVHNNHRVFKKCEAAMSEAEKQMSELRKRYMNL